MANNISFYEFGLSVAKFVPPQWRGTCVAQLQRLQRLPLSMDDYHKLLQKKAVLDMKFIREIWMIKLPYKWITRKKEHANEQLTSVLAHSVQATKESFIIIGADEETNVAGSKSELSWINHSQRIGRTRDNCPASRDQRCYWIAYVSVQAGSFLNPFGQNPAAHIWAKEPTEWKTSSAATSRPQISIWWHRKTSQNRVRGNNPQRKRLNGNLTTGAEISILGDLVMWNVKDLSSKNTRTYWFPKDTVFEIKERIPDSDNKQRLMTL